MSKNIALAQNDEEIQGCYAVMSELRRHISADEFLPQVTKQAAVAGYQLVFLSDEGSVKAVAGFRVSKWLATGKYLCVEDFASKSGERSKGYGGELFDWLVAYAKEKQCNQIQLVSRVTRFDAHRFYLRKRMNIEAHYFTLDL